MRSNNIINNKILPVMIAAIIISALLIFTFTPPAYAEENDGTQDYTSIYQLAGKRAGVLTGSIHDQVISETLGSADIRYYNSYAEEPIALKEGKIDCFVIADIIFKNVAKEISGLKLLPEYLQEFDLGFILPKGASSDELCSEFNEFLAHTKADGSFDALYEAWTSEESTNMIVGYDNLTGENGEIHMAINTGASYPFIYVQNNRYAGFEIALMTEFCKEKGYSLLMDDISSFDGVLMAVSSGKYDIGASSLTITEERKESVKFTDITISGGLKLAVTDSSATATEGNPFIDSFEKTFTRENRWLLFVNGVICTIVITLSSVALGTLLGYIMFLGQRKGNPAADKLCRFFCWLIGGIPTVVLLMILCYLVFGHVALNGEIISIIGFTIIFAANMIGMLKTGVDAIDKGQTEAAYALGYSDKKTFRKIILPQAVKLIYPSYKNAIVQLLKGTSVVGYIAVQDLTKISDIIRSRTYDAFFPLIITTIIYFLISALIIFLVKKINFHTSPERKTEKILKNIKTD